MFISRKKWLKLINRIENLENGTIEAGKVKYIYDWGIGRHKRVIEISTVLYDILQNLGLSYDHIREENKLVEKKK